MKARGVVSSAKHIQIQKAASTVFGTVAIASIVVSFSIVFLNLLWGTSKFNSKVHSEQEAVRDTLKANLAAAPDLQQSFNNLEVGANLIGSQDKSKKNSEVVLDALPSKFDYPALVASLSNLAELTSVNLQSVDGIDLGQEAEQLSSSPTPVEIPITVDIEGSYTAMKKFLAGIENSIRPLDVQSINISGTDSNLRISLAIKTYYQPAFDVQVGKKEVR